MKYLKCKDVYIDIMADTAVIPMPIWCREDAKDTMSKMDKHQKQRLSQQIGNSDIDKILKEDVIIDDDIENDEWQFCGHSGIYATLMRDFHRIWKIINIRIAMFDNLYVIGHSLGGGLAILFALESIINKYVPSNKSMQVVTFGSPVVISYENDFNSLSRHAKKILFELHNCCHCFVNRFDPVPRVPARIEWMMTVIPYALRKIIAEQVKEKMKLPGFLLPLVKSGVKSGVSKFIQYVEKYLDLLQSYHPFGTYYFFAGKDCDEPFITKNQTVIEELLGFIPPHKIVTSTGQELRVSHYSTKQHGIKHDSRFSLADITSLTSNDDNDNDNIIQPGSDNNKDKDKEEEKKVNILELLINKSKEDDDGEGTLYDNTSLYVAVESDDDKVRDIYRAKKFSEKGWIMLVSNHLVEQYIDIFKAKVQSNKSKYPMLSPKSMDDHFAAPEVKEDETEIKKEDTINKDEVAAVVVATAVTLKETGKKWWNQAKDKYNKEKEEYLKRKELEKQNQKTKSQQQQQSGYPGLRSNTSNRNVVNPNTSQIQPAQVQQQQTQYIQQPVMYVQPPQQLQGQQPPPQQQYHYYHQPPTQYIQQPVMYVQQPQNISQNGQQIGATQYRIAQQPTHYVVYPQQPPQQQPQQGQLPKANGGYPTLSKR